MMLHDIKGSQIIGNSVQRFILGNTKNTQVWHRWHFVRVIKLPPVNLAKRT